MLAMACLMVKSLASRVQTAFRIDTALNGTRCPKKSRKKSNKMRWTKKKLKKERKLL